MFVDLIKDIKSKKLENLDDDIIEKEIEKYFRINVKDKKFVKKSNRSKDYKKIVKNIRNKLNRIYGQYWYKNRSFNQRNIKSLYKDIFKITKKPKILLDISCGLDPLRYKDKSINYIVTEFTKTDCDFLREYLSKNNFKFKVLKIDLRENFNLPKGDVAFLFRILDVLQDKKLAERIVKKVNVKFLVVSFSLITIRDKKMKFPYFPWFERMLNRLGLKYRKLLYESEVFYIIEK